MVNENGIKNIRMGWKNSFIKGVILSDDTIIQNMQCRLDAKIPTDDELEKNKQRQYAKCRRKSF